MTAPRGYYEYMPKFGELPYAIQHSEPELVQLTYDHEQEAFFTGSIEHALDSSELLDALLWPSGSVVPTENIADLPVLLDVFAHPITTPKLFTWLKEKGGPKLFQETSDVMRDVFSKLQDIQLEKRHHKKMSPFGFSCEFIREGHVTLSVLGNCACLGTNPDGHTIDWYDWESGFAELEFHNIDMPEQRISLLAGLGHLATRCLVDSTNRPELRE
jgi:hypothetical protein